jgi:hypothetical protein
MKLPALIGRGFAYVDPRWLLFNAKTFTLEDVRVGQDDSC